MCRNVEQSCMSIPTAEIYAEPLTTGQSILNLPEKRLFY